MRVLGVVPSSIDLRLALVDGTRSAPTLLLTPTKTQKLPSRFNEGPGLRSLYSFVTTFLREQGVEKICVLHAGNSQFGGPSAERIKAEAIIQLGGADLSLPTELISPQTLRAQEKKFIDQAHGTPESVFNSDKQFVPKPWRDAVLVAWIGLKA